MKYQLILRNDDGTEITFDLNPDNPFNGLIGVSIIEHSGRFYVDVGDIFGMYEHVTLFGECSPPQRIDNIQGIIK